MSKLSFVEKLLDGAEVEWKALGEVAEYSKTRISFDLLDEDNYVGVDNLLQNRAGKSESNYVPTSGNLTEYRECDILIGNIRPYLKKIWYADCVGGTNGDVLVIHPIYESINPRYLYQVLTDERFFDYNMQHSKGAKMPRGNKAKIMEYSIPIPCPENPEKSLAVQAEIVRVLDAFMEVTAELTAELTARKKQYTYYRDQLLTFAEGQAEWKTLGDLFDFKNGINKGKEFFGKGNQIINYTDVFKNNKLFEETILGKVESTTSDIERFNCQKGDVFFTRTSETKDEIGYAAVLLSDIPKCVFSGFLLRARPITNLLLPEYCAYCFASNQLRKEIIQSSNMTTRVTTTGSILSKIKIPIPPLAEQARIVAILDKFDTLTNSISHGLPREIALRQQQYEYYREQLLTFPQPEGE